MPLSGPGSASAETLWPVPRNVVTLSPRLLLLVTKARRERIEACLGELYRYRRVEDRIEIDFPKRDLDARTKVIAELDAIDPKWRRAFAIYPRA